MDDFDDGFERVDVMKIVKIVGIAIFVIILFLILRGCGSNNDTAKIELVGQNPMIINQNEVFIEPGYNIVGTKNASDFYANVDGYVNTNKAGTYLLTYSLYNKKKRVVSEEVRQVIVLENSLENVSIFLKGDEEEYFFADDYTDHGVEAYDSDKDISDQVEINNGVNQSRTGSYQVVYQITSGNSVKEVVRKVNIINYNIERKIDEKSQLINLTIKCNDYYYTILPDGTEFYSKYITYAYDKVGIYEFDVYLKSGSHKKYVVEITRIKEPEEENNNNNSNNNYIDDVRITGTCTLEYKNNRTALTMKVNNPGQVTRYIVNGTQFTGSTYYLSGYVSRTTVIAFNRANKPYSIKCENKTLLYPNGLQPVNHSKLGWFPCNSDVSAANQELATKIATYGQRTRGAVATAATFLANYKYNVQYFWAGKYEQKGLNPRWGCRAGYVEQQVCSVKLDETYCEWGLDCTGFTKWAYIQAGFEPGLIPRSAQEQSAWGSFIAPRYLFQFGNGNATAAIKPGDLVATPLVHVGVVIGVDGSRVQVAHESGGIKVTTLSKATGKSMDGNGDFSHFVLMDEFYKTYGTGK